jgi:hypothetical protein
LARHRRGLVHGPDFLFAILCFGIKGSRKNKFTFWRERRAGRCKAPRRRRCGDIVEDPERCSGPPPRPEGRQARLYTTSYTNLTAEPPTVNAAAECEVIFARALSRDGAAAFFDAHTNTDGILWEVDVSEAVKRVNEKSKTK